MRKTLLFSVIAIFAMLFTVSCTRDDSILTLDAQNHAVEKSDHSVSVENALKYLEGDLAMIDPEETRATQPRIVKSVKHVPFKSVRSTTRAAADAPNDISDLLYLVEFEDGRGSAVLGADDRIEPVLAILDESVFTVEDFTALPEEANNDISVYMASLIKETATSMINDFPRKPIFPNDSINTNIMRPTVDTVINLVKQPLLETKWDQNAPYNNLCYNEQGQKCLAGCVAIAAAQLIANKFHNMDITINGNTFDWNLIEQGYYGNTMSSAAQTEIARFVHEIGLAINTQYGTEASSAYLQDVIGLLDSFGNAIDVDPTLHNFYSSERGQLLNHDCPMLIRGARTKTNENGELEDVGHAWLIDGCNDYEIIKTDYITTINPNDGSLNIEQTVDRISVEKSHCNFGWGGVCDGYYTDLIFDLSIPRTGEDIDTSVGDISQVSNRYYYKDFYSIYYLMNPFYN